MKAGTNRRPAFGQSTEASKVRLQNRAKVETLDFSAASPFGAIYGGPWSFLCETMRFLISSRAKGMSGPENFGRRFQKDFFDTIGGNAGLAAWAHWRVSFSRPGRPIRDDKDAI